jgi:SAM-dependent methyltransferase
MGEDKSTSDRLDEVYGARDAGEIARAYDSWAQSYDAEMAQAGYRHPAICLALLCRYLPAGSGPVLDAGAGTGLIGEWLPILGYGRAEALDISTGMLEVARAKGVYTRLHIAALGGPLPFAGDHFAAVISTGVFTTGHVGAEAFDELIRITKPAGVIVLSAKDELWQQSLAPLVARRSEAGVLELVEETPSYISMPGQPDAPVSHGVVLRVL